MFKKITILILILSIFTVGCEDMENESLLPEEIVETALNTNEDIENYHIVSKMQMLENGKLIEEITTKEWTGKVDGEIKRRTEITSEESGKIISVMDGEKFLMYQEDKNEVLNLGSDIQEESNWNKSLKKRTINELDMITKMYNIEVLGEEEVNERNTYHLKGEPKEESTLLGEYEIWIDKESWVVVKSISNSGNMEVRMENQKIDLNPEIDPSMFQLDIPEDAKIVDIEDDFLNSEELSLEEAWEKLDEKLLYINNDEYELKQIQEFTYDSEDIPNEIMFSYVKNGEKAFDMSVLKREMQADTSMGYEEIEIRENTGYIMDDIIKIIIFSEDGIQYNIILDEGNMTIEEAIEVVENMEKYEVE